MWLFRWDETPAVSKQPEFAVSQRHQAGDSKSPGAEGTRASRRSRKKAEDLPALCPGDESSGKRLGSARLERHCREERPAVQDGVRRKERSDDPFCGTRLVRKRWSRGPQPESLIPWPHPAALLIPWPHPAALLIPWPHPAALLIPWPHPAASQRLRTRPSRRASGPAASRRASVPPWTS
ncbi:hypothetical protein SRHO_G00039990 [Serrasalmus rhombeus]